jgi:hypothetical protein
MRAFKFFMVFLVFAAVLFLLSACGTPSTGYMPSGYAYPTDSVGNVQYHKGGWTTSNGTVYQTDRVGNVRYNKGGVKTK